MSFLGLTQASRNRFFYHTPYQDIAQTYLPVTVKELFQYTKYYYRVNPVIAPVIDKMAEYPITNFVIENKDEDFRKRTKDFVDVDLRLRETLIGMGQDWGVYGNSFVSIIYPFNRYLKCDKCKSLTNIEHSTKWKYQNHKWSMYCFECKMNVDGTIEDRWIKDPKKIKFHRWTVEQIDIQYNPFTGESNYYYRISPKERKLIESGIKHYVAKTPKVFLEAVKSGKDVKLTHDNLFHFKRTSIADDQLAWGMPIMYPALKEAFHWQILRKANEAISFQYIVPLTIIFPQPHGEANPYTHLGMGDWRRFVESQLNRWKRDPNHIPVMPIPLGSQQLFGNARALMVGPEMEQVANNIIAACQVPREFVYGGLSYSGTSVSLRMLENHFLIYREQITRFLRWMSQKMHTFLEWPEFSVRLSDFKMADDIQKKQFMAQLAAQRVVSNSYLLEDAGLDYRSELERISEELKSAGELTSSQQIEQAKAAGEAMKVQAKYQAEAEIEGQSYRKKLLEEVGKEEERKQLLDTMNHSGQIEGMSQFDPMQLAGLALDKLKSMGPEDQQSQLKHLQTQWPQLIGVMNQVAESKMQFQQQIQPLPEQKPPTRGAGKGVI
jgi:hypothetical protein